MSTVPAHPQSETNDPLYAACLSYLSNRHATLWSDFILPDNIIPAARWLSAQIQGVAEHYDATDTPFFTTATEPLTAPYDGYSGPYSTEHSGGGRSPRTQPYYERDGQEYAGQRPFNPLKVLEETLKADPDYATTPRQRPSATATHGQQPERW